MDYGGRSEREVGLDAIRALHHTVIALRTALEESKSEILELKNKAFPIETVQDALRALSIENNILRQKLVNGNLNKIDKAIETEKHSCTDVDLVNDNENSAKSVVETPLVSFPPEDQLEGKTLPKHLIEGSHLAEEHANGNEDFNKFKKVTIITPHQSPKRNLEARISVKAELKNQRSISKSLESLTVIKSGLEHSKRFTFSKTFSFSNSNSQIKRDFVIDLNESSKMNDENEETGSTQNELINESIEEGSLSPQNDLDPNEEVDDIELIFTTDETNDSDFKEHLVSIDVGDNSHDLSNLLQLPLSDLDQNLDISDRELDDDVFNDNFENENQENTNFQSFEVKRENSQLCDSKSDMSINQEKSMKSYYSLQDSSFDNKSLEKDESFDRFDDRIRIVETDISKCGIHDVEYVVGRRNTCPNPIQYRPLLHREALSRGLTVGKKIRPILTHSNAIRKESGAQTDISALPGSSWRSESSLANKARLGDNFTTLPSKYPLPGSRLRLSEKTVEARRVLLSDIGFTSMVPELSRSADHLFPPVLRPSGPAPSYGQFLKTTDLYSPSCQSQRFGWVAAATSPSDHSQSQSQSHYGSMYPLTSPPTSSRRCSAPVSPMRKNLLKQTPSKVRFANGSLPELRGDWSTVDSGDSTDSLVEEAENYLRRSIDCIMTGRDMVSSNYCESKQSVPRRSSAPEPANDNSAPTGWQPFLPRIPRDLKMDYWVKIITPEGRVRGGRVRYVGPIAAQPEHFVGVQLCNPDGNCDGAYNTRRYFQCEPYHGMFVPFKKVIMGWRP